MKPSTQLISELKCLIKVSIDNKGFFEMGPSPEKKQKSKNHLLQDSASCILLQQEAATFKKLSLFCAPTSWGYYNKYVRWSRGRKRNHSDYPSLMKWVHSTLISATTIQGLTPPSTYTTNSFPGAVKASHKEKVGAHLAKGDVSLAITCRPKLPLEHRADLNLLQTSNSLWKIIFLA